MQRDDPWPQRLEHLCARVREAARACVARALESGGLAAIGEPMRQGAGDVTYAIDDATERAVDAWLDGRAREAPLSLLTEDAGWRHRGPDGRGGTRELAGFDHGGPRIALDPIDGTRNLMADLRSAWTVVSFAPAGGAQPRLSDLTLGVVSEIPDSRAARFRVLAARAGEACRLELRDVAGGGVVRATELHADADARADRGYFPFFRYAPHQRPALAEIEAAFFERLRAHEQADLRHVFDDQYISNAGQLALLALGTYRMIADVRAWLARRSGDTTITSKPYDVAGAIVVARAAGCVVEAPLGEPLDFPIDVTTPIDFVGWANSATATRLAPHLHAVLRG